MGKGIFITGTGTDIGKTYVTALIVKKLNEQGRNAAYYKAAVSGNSYDSDGKLIPLDAKYVKDISGINQPVESMCPYIYERAVSPHLASRIEGNPVDLEVVKDGYDRLAEKYDTIVMEGSGGILCPICFDEREIWLEDIVKELQLPSIIVADAGLGTINSVVLTVYYMQQKGMDIQGIILNNYIKGDIMHEDNIKMIKYKTGLDILALVKSGDTDIDIDIKKII